MEECVYEVEMMYIQNTSGNDYTLEARGRRTKGVKLMFSNVDGIEFSPRKPLEIKHSYLCMNEGESKVWNLQFPYAMNFCIKFALNKIMIDFA
ncbi:MAG: hypothetical protein GY765_33730 [bacterium]|nr:hypothetical protein [bacterium]